MKNQKGNFQFILILGIAVVALGLAGFSLLKKGKVLPFPNTPVPSPTLIVRKASNGNVANWKTYTNTDVGYSFKFPENLIIKRADLYGIGGTKGILKNKDKDIFIGIYYPNTDMLQGDEENFLLHFKLLEESEYLNIVENISSQKVVTINTIPFIQYWSINNSNKLNSYLYTNPQSRLEIITSTDESNQILINQILSTFQFTK